MSRMHRFARLSRRRNFRIKNSPRHDRRWRFESLEDRRLLAVITVTSLADNLFPGGGVTLREAVQAANTDASVDGSIAGSGADTIEFDGALSGQTITLGGADLDLTEALTIDARALASPVTIDANNASRILNITATTGNFSLAGLTLTGGRTTGDNNFGDTTFSGGAVRSLTLGNLTIDQGTVSGNSTTGDIARGGGIFSIGAVTLTSSTVSGNITAGFYARGSGIFPYGAVTLISSTVTDNHAQHSYATGGGIWNDNDPISITHSIVAGNTAAGGSPDIYSSTGSFAVDFSLLGTAVTPDPGGSGNLFNDTPLLGPLACNGGPTETHALLASSSAIDAGSPGFDVVVIPTDQRGAPFASGVGIRVDIGAYERQT